MTSVTTRVPASTSNIGPGFDCLGIALDIANRVTITRDGAGELPEIARGAAAEFFAAAKVAPFGFGCRIEGDVPRSRGLGSSVTVRLGVIHGLNRLSGSPLGAEMLFEICTALEGHPDNAAPAAFGGFTVSRARMETIRCEVAPELKFVLLIPDFEISTPAARKVLPDTLPRAAAVLSASNACRITAAFLRQRYDLLRGAFADGLHQPYREHLIPFLGSAIAAGEKAGALGGFLSGSGSTICCLTLENADEVAAAMLSAAPPGAHVVTASANNTGATILEDGAA